MQRKTKKQRLWRLSKKTTRHNDTGGARKYKDKVKVGKNKKTKLMNKKEKMIFAGKEYKTPADYQKYLRAGGTSADYVFLAGILYTMDEYDIDGHTITYGNKKEMKMMTIETANRYGPEGFNDAVIELDEMISWREDIQYAE